MLTIFIHNLDWVPLQNSNRSLQELTYTVSPEDYLMEDEQPEDYSYDYAIDYRRKRNDASKLELCKQLFSQFGRSTPKNFLRLIRFT